MQGLQTNIYTAAYRAFPSHPDAMAMDPCAHSPLCRGKVLTHQHLELKVQCAPYHLCFRYSSTQTVQNIDLKSQTISGILFLE